MILLRKNNYLLLFIALIIFSCKKKDIENNPPTISNSNPEFYFNGTINGQILILEAGKNNYYLYTDCNYDNSITTYVFSGEFKPSNCTTCPNSLKISITDDTTIANSSPSHINNLSTTNYSYYYPTNQTIINSYIMNIYAVPIYSAAVNYQYFLDNTLISNNPNVSNYTITPTAHTIKSITNNLTDSCFNNTLINTINLTTTDSFYTYYRYSLGFANNVVTFTIIPSAPTIHSYTLSFGDGDSIITTNSIITHTYASNLNFYTAQLKSKSISNKPWTFTNIINTDFTYTRCTPNFYYKFSPMYSIIPFNPYSKIKIEYTSSSFKTYASYTNSQPSDAYFTITKIENYKNNENNLPTKKITAEFKCRLFNTTNPNDFIDIQGICVFAVAYK
ncbi:MAG: hypothetical protein KatS3mg027_0513 [Bacteroidia bacterium]|nr:MAG: hypothetical protein KatS3mg027_0513 [Bacteroidia bacterium]